MDFYIVTQMQREGKGYREVKCVERGLETSSGCALLSLFGTLVIVILGFLYNNSRMSDSRADLMRRMDDTRDLMRAEAKSESAELRSEIVVLRSETNARFDRFENKLDKLGETMLQMLADHEQRVNRLEGRG